MKENNLNGKKHIHFIGIGGISMSALANVSLTKGLTVSGSDSKESEVVQELRILL